MESDHPRTKCSPAGKPRIFLMLHQSDPNHSNRRRIGLAVRVIIPIVKVLDWDSPEHTLITISGKDRLGINDRSENGTMFSSRQLRP